MTFGLQCDEPTSVSILNRAAEGGIDFIDSSDVYPLGGDLTSQLAAPREILGRWLHGRRDRFTVATKCFGRTGPSPFDGGNSRKHIFDAVDASLRRLQTDYIDLYQLHGFDSTARSTRRWVRSTVLSIKARSATSDVQIFLTYQLVRAIGRSETLGLARFDSVQPRYNLLFRQIEREMLPFCGDEAVGVIPYNPLAGGLLLAGSTLETLRHKKGRASPSAMPASFTRTAIGTSMNSTPSTSFSPGPGGSQKPRGTFCRLGNGQPGDHRADRRCGSGADHPGVECRRMPMPKLDADLKGSPGRNHPQVSHG